MQNMELFLKNEGWFNSEIRTKRSSIVSTCWFVRFAPKHKRPSFIIKTLLLLISFGGTFIYCIYNKYKYYYSLSDDRKIFKNHKTSLIFWVIEITQPRKIYIVSSSGTQNFSMKNRYIEKFHISPIYLKLMK